MGRHAIDRDRLPENRVRQLAHERGLTNEQLGAAIDRSGSAVSRYATGVATIPDDVKIAMSAYLDVPIQHLMGWDTLGGCNS